MKSTAMPWLWFVALTFLQGCATDFAPPLEARWYFELDRTATSPAPSVAERKRTSRPQIEILLLNRAASEIRIDRVFLNSYERDLDPDNAKTWVLERRIFLAPGGYTILGTNTFSRAADASSKAAYEWFSDRCLLPVSLAVQVPQETRSSLEDTYGHPVADDEGRVPVDMPDRLPNALPRQWSRCGDRTD